MKSRQKNTTILIGTAAAIIGLFLYSQYPSENRMLEKCADEEFGANISKRGYSLKTKISQSSSYRYDFARCEKYLQTSPREFKIRYK